jgi:hypothetical protein
MLTDLWPLPPKITQLAETLINMAA